MRSRGHNRLLAGVKVQGVIDQWNCLLRNGVDPKSLHGFKERLEKFKEEKALWGL